MFIYLRTIHCYSNEVYRLDLKKALYINYYIGNCSGWENCLGMSLVYWCLLASVWSALKPLVMSLASPPSIKFGVQLPSNLFTMLAYSTQAEQKTGGPVIPAWFMGFHFSNYVIILPYLPPGTKWDFMVIRSVLLCVCRSICMHFTCKWICISAYCTSSCLGIGNLHEHRRDWR